MSKPTFDIAIVTSCHNYGKYLGDWARSIVALTIWPRCVVMVDNGSTDGTHQQMLDVAQLLRGAGVEDVRTKRTPLTDFGTARNEAVRMGEGPEWVMHMDVDDMFMPHCLEDVKRFAPEADVIPLGYERCGDLKSGPRNRTRTYRNSRGIVTLKSVAPASGVSPFRRSLWEQTPYRTDMIGGWDTALWIGFAHLNARFIAVRRPCFFYRQHADSIFNQRRNHRRRGRMVGAKLNNLRRKRHGVSILVPRRGDGGGPRDKSWAWVRAHYQVAHPDWEIVEAECDKDGPWRKGVAVTRALDQSHGDIIIIADSDCILPRAALEEAVLLVEMGEAPWAIPHLMVRRLNKVATAAVLELPATEAEPPFQGGLDRHPYIGFPGGGFIVVDASAWSATGGMPTAFAGWGAEDEATAEILDTLIGPHIRLEHDLWHLWHPHARKSNQQHHRSNRSLLRLVRSLAGDADAMFTMLEQIAAGVSLSTVFSSNFDGDNAVQMVALMAFKRGTQVIKQHEYFLATQEEAKRHDARPRRIAVRAGGAIADALGGRERTLEIRSTQHIRNLKALADAAARKAMLNGSRVEAISGVTITK